MLAFYENLLSEDYDKFFGLIRAGNKIVCLVEIPSHGVNAPAFNLLCLAQQTVFGLEIGGKGNDFHFVAKDRRDFDFICKRFKIKFLNNERTN